MELTQQITEVIEELQGLLLAEKYLVTLNAKIEVQLEVTEILGKRLEKEGRDLEKYENKPIKFLFQDILKSETEQLEIERQEYLHAVLMLKDGLSALKLLEFEQKILQEKILKLPKQKELLERLIVQRDKAMIEKGHKQHSEIMNLYREIDHVTKVRREIFEAKDAGLKCKKTVTRVLELFEIAAKMRDWNQSDADVQGWEVRDFSAEKYAVDDAVTKFDALKIHLTKFEHELEDIHEHDKLNLLNNTIKFNSFISSYNNSLINDWVVRKKLSSAIALLEALQDDILRLINTVDQKSESNDALMQSLEERRMAILESEMK